MSNFKVGDKVAVCGGSNLFIIKSVAINPYTKQEDAILSVGGYSGPTWVIETRHLTLVSDDSIKLAEESIQSLEEKLKKALEEVKEAKEKLEALKNPPLDLSRGGIVVDLEQVLGDSRIRIFPQSGHSCHGVSITSTGTFVRSLESSAIVGTPKQVLLNEQNVKAVHKYIMELAIGQAGEP